MDGEGSTSPRNECACECARCSVVSCSGCIACVRVRKARAREGRFGREEKRGSERAKKGVPHSTGRAAQGTNGRCTAPGLLRLLPVLGSRHPRSSPAQFSPGLFPLRDTDTWHARVRNKGSCGHCGVLDTCPAQRDAARSWTETDGTTITGGGKKREERQWSQGLKARVQARRGQAGEGERRGRDVGKGERSSARGAEGGLKALRGGPRLEQPKGGGKVR